MSHSVEAVIFDWAGTVVDFGSWAPTSIFVQAIKQAYDFDISLEEARIPMGLGKWDHIRALGDLPQVKERWCHQFGHPMADSDVNAIYHAFMPLQKAKVAELSDPIPGALDTVSLLRSQNIKIGSCTGYPREVVDILAPVAAEKGYRPDCIIATDDLAAGARPGPWMALQNVINLGITSVTQCIKVDDSAPGITEGLAAGMWTVGLSLSGNEAGMTLEEFRQASDGEKARKREIASDKLFSAGAHYVVDTIADLPKVISDVNRRLNNREKP